MDKRRVKVYIQQASENDDAHKSPDPTKRKTLESMDSGFHDDMQKDEEENLYEPMDVHVSSAASAQLQSHKPKPRTESGTFNVQQSGRMVILNPMGLSLLIPKDAVLNNTVFNIVKRNDPSEMQSIKSMFKDSDVLSDIIELCPHKYTFNDEITVKIHINDIAKLASDLKLLYSPTEGVNNSKWMAVPNDDGNGDDGAVISWCMLGKYCYVQMRHFCKVAVIGQNDNSGDQNDDSSTEVVPNDGNESDGYHEIDEIDGNFNDLEAPSSNGPRISSKPSDIDGKYNAQLCIESIDAKMINLEVRLTKCPDVSGDVLDGLSKKLDYVMDSHKIFLEDGPLHVQLNLHNKVLKLRNGESNSRVLKEKLLTKSEIPPVRFFLERTNNKTVEIEDLMCQISVKFHEDEVRTPCWLFACLGQTQYNPTVLRMDKSWKDIQTLEKTKTGHSANQRYIKDPTNKHKPAPGIAEDYSEVRIEENRTEENDEVYINNVIMEDNKKRNHPQLPEHSEPVYENHMSPQCTDEDGRDPAIYMNFQSIQSKARNMSVRSSSFSGKEDCHLDSESHDCVTDNASSEDIYMNAPILMKRKHSTKQESRQECINRNSQIIYVSNMIVDNLNVTTTNENAEHDEGIDEFQNQFPHQNSDEYKRFIPSELPAYLKEDILHCLRNRVPSYALSVKSVLSMCIMDYDFEMIKNICLALKEKSRKYSKLVWEVRKEKLRQKCDHVGDIMKVGEVIDKMYSKSIMSHVYMEKLDKIKSDREKTLFIINNIVLKLNSYDFKQFVKILEETGQSHIVKMLEFDILM